MRLSGSFQFMKALDVYPPADRRELRVLNGVEVTAELACVLLSCDMS